MVWKAKPPSKIASPCSVVVVQLRMVTSSVEFNPCRLGSGGRGSPAIPDDRGMNPCVQVAMMGSEYVHEASVGESDENPITSGALLLCCQLRYLYL